MNRFNDSLLRPSHKDEVDRRWKLVHTFWRQCQRLFPTSSILQKCIDHMASLLFHYQKKKYFITRLLFIRIVNTCISFNTGAKQNTLLNAIYDTFDPLGRDEFEWRKFLFMIRALSWLQVSVSYYSFRDLILSAFRFYTTEDDTIASEINVSFASDKGDTSINRRGNKKIFLFELKNVVEYLINPDKVLSVLDLLEKIYIDTILSTKSFEMSNDIKLVISYSFFENILDHITIRNLTEE